MTDHLHHGDPGPGDQIGDYEVLERVARGGMATVLSVRHVRTGEQLGLKLLLPLALADESRSRFRREFRAMSRLHHPNVLRVHEWGLLGDRPWFTMELLEGHDLREEIEGLRQMPAEERFARIRSILVQVARALSHIHERGLIHRDVTPGNIFVGPQGATKLMDFGVVKEMGADLTGVGEVIGTVAYMAPEQISGDPVDARADLYSLGAVLYLMLTGQRPFSAHTIHGFMEKHLNARARPPREVDPEVPQELAEMCLRLLEKQPHDRFASAMHLLHLLDDEQASIDLEDRWPPRTVGRTRIKARLRDGIEEVASGNPGSALMLTAPLGAGKTRLLELAEHMARRLGLPVASGRCRHHDRPFGAFVGVYRHLKGDDPPALLHDVFDPADEGKHWERYPVLAAFREMVVDHAPLVVVIDDLQRADPATLELLTYLVRNTLELATEPVLFVLGHDDTQHPLRHHIETLASVEALEVSPLDSSEVEELVVSVLGSDPAAMTLAARLHQESNGSPAFIADMLRGLRDDGLIVEDKMGAWRLTVGASEITRSRLPMPASLRQALQERLAPLSEDAMELGRVLALARRRIDLDVLVDAASVDEDRVIEAIDDLIDADIVEEHRAEDTERVELSHGRFRDVLLHGLAPESRRVGHQRMGEALERQHRSGIGAVVEELAYHFEQAELPSKAYPYLARTAERHLARSLFQESLTFLDRAIAMEPTARPLMLLEDADRMLADLYLKTSQARYQLGQLPAALEATEKAQALARLVRDPGLESSVASELGVQLRQQGRISEAETQLVLAVQRAEEAGDQTLLLTPLYQLGGLSWGRGRLEVAEEHWRRGLQIAQQVGDERAQGHGYNGLAILAICRGQSMEARRHLEQSARVFEQLGMLSPVVIAWVNLIELYLNTGTLRKALSLADRTLSQAEEIGHLQGMALGRGWRSRALLTLGRVDEAARNGREAVRLAHQLGNHEDEAFALSNQVMVALVVRDWDLALSTVDDLLAVLAIHDHENVLPEAIAWKVRALAALGRLDDARATLDTLPTHSDLWPHVQVRTDLALGRAFATLGDQARAREFLQRALSASEANGFRFFQLLAHLDLVVVQDDESARDRHLRVARGLGRSLAANLPRDDARRFQLHHLGPAADSG